MTLWVKTNKQQQQKANVSSCIIFNELLNDKMIGKIVFFFFFEPNYDMSEGWGRHPWET